MDVLVTKVGSFLIGLLGFIAAFGVAVFIHELGHFLAAKLFKVQVDRFVIGFDREALPFMPRCIWEKRIGETTYGLSIVPLGGYVKMEGVVHPDIEKYLEESEKNKQPPETDTATNGEETETANETDTAEESRLRKDTLAGQAVLDQAALYKKPFWQKTIIYGAGVTMNLVLAMGIVAIIGIRGDLVNPPYPAEVGWLKSDSLLATEYGIQSGDRITAVDGSAVETDEDYQEALYEPVPRNVPLGFLTALASPPEGYIRDVAITFSRDGEEFERSFDIDVNNPSERDVELITITSMPASVGYVQQFKPAHRAGLKEGDLIEAIGGEPIDDWKEMLHIVRNSPNTALDFTIRRGDEIKEYIITPEENAKRPETGLIGIQQRDPNPVREHVGLGEAVTTSPMIVVNYTIRYAQNLGNIFGRLFRGHFKEVREDLGGPAAIAGMAGYHANLGLDRFLQFMLMLNIALAVMNILPLPILDGGHIVLAAWEGLFGKPMSPRILVPVLNGAVVVLLGFVVLITVSDVLKMVWK